MLKENSNLLYRILNVWFAFIALLFFSSYLPHWQNVTYLTYINEAIYFLLFIISVSIFFRENNNRDIYFNFSVFFLLHSFSFLNIFIGDGYLLGNNSIGWYFYTYKSFILTFSFNFVVIYIVLKYLFLNQRSWMIYMLTFVILLSVFIGKFLPYLKDPVFINKIGNVILNDLNKRFLLAYGISFVSIVLYAYLLYKKDKILGTYISLIIASYSIFLVSDIIDALALIYGIQIFSIGQYVLTLNLIFLFIIFFKKLYFLCSEYGQFYESLINRKIIFSKLKVKRFRSELHAQILLFLRLYLYQRRNYLFMLCLLSTLTLYYFRFPTFFTINLTALVLCSTILFLFINALYKRRAKQEYILP